MGNTPDVISGKPIVIWSWFISSVSSVNPLVAFYDIHGWNGEVLFFCSVPDTTRDFFFTYYFELRLDWIKSADLRLDWIKSADLRLDWIKSAELRLDWIKSA
jgi:hypothetical protein